VSAINRHKLGAVLKETEYPLVGLTVDSVLTELM